MTDAASGILVAGIEGPKLTPAELSFFQKEQLAGVTIFRWNVTPQIEDLRELLTVLDGTRSGNSPKYLTAIDQEGGRVTRLGAPFPNLGPAQGVAEGRWDASALTAIRTYGLAVGSALKTLGININFAPVCDLLTNPTNLAIGDRVWGTEPEGAALRAGAFLQGMTGARVMGCLKHFPGQGDAAVDTHIGMASVRGTYEQLESRELLPFGRLLPEAPMVMMAHVIYPDVCAKRASASEFWIGDCLRKKLGFTGVVVSDDMNMGAVAQDEKRWQGELVESVMAGTDMLLVCRYLERFKTALEGLRREMAKSQAFSRRMDEAAARVLGLRRGIG